MNPFHFGPRQRPLFGLYHPPTRRPIRPEGVVLCNPMGLEYMRTHRALQRLARSLADQGHHVLRFDYYGTGDSSGDGNEVELGAWRDDVEYAIDELIAISGVLRVSLVGVRLGGTLAFETAASRRDVADTALWDPIVRGPRYLGELLRAPGPVRPGDPAAFEVRGYLVPDALRAALDALDLTRHEPPGGRVGLFLSDPDPDVTVLSERLEGIGVDVERRDFPEPGVWNDRRRLGHAVLAPDLVTEVCGWLC